MVQLRGCLQTCGNCVEIDKLSMHRCPGRGMQHGAGGRRQCNAVAKDGRQDLAAAGASLFVRPHELGIKQDTLIVLNKQPLAKAAVVLFEDFIPQESKVASELHGVHTVSHARLWTWRRCQSLSAGADGLVQLFPGKHVTYCSDV